MPGDRPQTPRRWQEREGGLDCRTLLHLETNETITGGAAIDAKGGQQAFRRDHVVFM